MLVNLNGALHNLLSKADVPHFAQYHSGGISQVEIDRWAQQNPWVKREETSEMINIQGSYV